ncbi:hypothetical protein GGI42DRAFT_173273 [Trichoderma sp. SZMC 28013]
MTIDDCKSFWVFLTLQYSTSLVCPFARGGLEMHIRTYPYVVSWFLCLVMIPLQNFTLVTCKVENPKNKRKREKRRRRRKKRKEK